MSDDFHRPTYTSADANNEPTNAEGRYNPTQVRLYGIPGKGGIVHLGPSVTIASFNDSATINVDFSDPAKAKDDIDRLQKVLAEMVADPRKPIIPTAQKHWAKVPLPGIPIGAAYQLGLDMQLAGTVYVGAIGPVARLSAGVMFGYAYEGHTYDFPKPKIMLVPSLPLTDPAYPAKPFTRPKDDSGYDAKFAEGYRVWLVDKLDQCVEIEANQGFVEQLVLDANMPGKRSPSAYRAAMALSHRGGRLSE